MPLKLMNNKNTDKNNFLIPGNMFPLRKNNNYKPKIKKMKRKIMLSVLFLWITGTPCVFSQIPPGYYNGTEGLIGTQLRSKLQNIISNHTVILYENLWQYFAKTDVKPNGKVWDMYSDIPGGTAPYQFAFGSDQCGQYSAEGDCFNREHSYPQSWFNNIFSPAYSDLFHLYPTDGFVNNKRGNFPYGDVSDAIWTSLNGSKLGNCSDSGYSGTVFEPVDSFKGDFARTFFYIAVRYYMQDQNWPGSDMMNRAEPKAWALAVLKAWHQLDPVSRKERDRNDSVFKYQHNRNPFIDKPQWVDSVWCGPLSVDETNKVYIKPLIYPNPANKKIFFDYYSDAPEQILLSVFSAGGQKIKEMIFMSATGKFTGSVDLSEAVAGVYSVRFVSRRNCLYSGVCIR